MAETNFFRRSCVRLVACCVLAMGLSFPVFAQTYAPSTDASGSVARAQFTSSVVDREPGDNLSSTSSDIQKLYFFTELRNMSGKTITHRWRYFDEIVTEIPFEIKGPRWRVFSYKSMQQTLDGEWSVELIDEAGASYGEHAILVTKGRGSAEPPGLALIKSLFPDGEYTLVNDSLASAQCPPGGRFSWQSRSNNLWTLNMGEQVHIRVHEPPGGEGALQPDAHPGKAGSECLVYSAHQFDKDQGELVTELQTDCVGEDNDIFSARSLSRQGNIIDLTIYEDDYAVCRYKLN